MIANYVETGDQKMQNVGGHASQSCVFPELLGDKKRLQHQPTTGELKCAQDEADIADDVDYKAQLQALVATQNHTAAIEDLD